MLFYQQTLAGGSWATCAELRMNFLGPTSTTKNMRCCFSKALAGKIKFIKGELFEAVLSKLK